MNKLLSSILIFIPFCIISQNRLNPPNRAIDQNSQNSIFFNKEFSRKGGVTRLVSDDNSIEGSFYLYDTFNNKSTIIDKSGKNYSIDNFNINLKDNSFVSRISKDSLFYFQNVSKVKIGGKIIEKIDNTIYTNLYSGEKINLYAQHGVILKDEVIDKLSYKVIKPKRWLKTRTLFYKKNESDELKIFKLGKKEIHNVLGADKAKEIKGFMKSNSLSYRDEKDIIKLLEFYNSL